jgi:cytochrome c oxidase subunit 4
MSATKHAEHAGHHGPSLATMLGVFGALMALTFATVGVAYQDLGRWSAPAALLIAAVKGTLVVLYFMHVRYASRLIGLYAAAGFAFMAILIGITMSEVAARPPESSFDPLRPGAAEAARPGHRSIDEEPP